MAIRVLVADDSLTVRRRIVEVLAAHPDFTVVAEAVDGAAAVALCQLHRPDVVTLDMMMPQMNGLQATEQIMAWCPTPILIVSSSTNRGALLKTYDALAAGAVDVLEKPTGLEAEGAWEKGLTDRLRLVARIKVITHPRARLNPQPVETNLHLVPARVPDLPTRIQPGMQRAYSLVVMGASTGGPGAVLEVLRGLPRDFALSLLLVIHIGEAFGPALAQWLDGLSPLRVTTALDGELVPEPGQGRVILAPPGRHLLIQGGRLRLGDSPEVHSCRPSVDVLFGSAAAELPRSAIAVLLTGMGRDGAAGMLRVRQAGGMTLAQDESTSVVYGMPREAALLGAARQILPLQRIAPTLQQLALMGGRT